MHERYVNFLLQSLLDFETLRSLYVLKIDTAERWSNSLNHLNKLVDICLVYFNVEHINISENLEKESLSFHNWLSSHCTDVSKSKNRCSVGNNSHEITLRCVFIYIFRILLNFLARLSYTWRVSQGQILLCNGFLSWNNLNFSSSSLRVIVKSLLFCVTHSLFI